MATAVAAEEPAWRFFGGGVAYRWRTTHGDHGHSRECHDPACDDEDWRRGNLDNSIGWRLGSERRFGLGRKLRFVAGGELSLYATEYNQSQTDLVILSLAAVGGLELDLDSVRLGVRGGVGGVVADGGRSGPGWLIEGAMDMALGQGAALRLAARRAELAGPATEEIALLLVSDTRKGRTGSWEYGLAWGISEPGGGVGDSLELSTVAFWRLAAYRRLGDGRQRLGLAFGATGHESRLVSDLGTVPGNQRGKWVLDVSATWERLAGRPGGVGWRWGGGVKLAGFHDDYGTLLVDSQGGEVRGGAEFGLVAGAGVEIARWGQLTLMTGVEQVYWARIGLGELRLLLGIEARP